MRHEQVLFKIVVVHSRFSAYTFKYTVYLQCIYIYYDTSIPKAL